MIEPMTLAALFILAYGMVRSRARRDLIARGYVKSQIDRSSGRRGFREGALVVGGLLTLLARFEPELVSKLAHTSTSAVRAYGPALGFSFLGIGNLLDAWWLQRLAKSIQPELLRRDGE